MSKISPPSKTRPYTLDQLFREVIKRLSREKLQYALAGGIAISLYRVQKRTTEDLDFLIYSETKSQQIAEQIIISLGLKPGIARKADLEGGPLFAIKRKSTPPYMVVGRDPNNPHAAGVDFILPPIPWFQQALTRAQSNQIDFGFGPIPTLTVEDILLSKFLSFQNDPKRFKDLDDLQSIFENKNDLDLTYLTGQMLNLKLPIPKAIQEQAPAVLKKASKTILKKSKALGSGSQK